MTGPAASAGLERGRGREQGKLAMRRVPKCRFESCALRVIDKLRGRVVARKREITVQRGRRHAEHLIRETPGMGMCACQRGDEGRAGHGVSRRFEHCAVICDAPRARNAGQFEVELTEMRSGKPRLEARRAVQSRSLDIGPRCIPVVGAGKYPVTVARANHVDARDAGKRAGGIFHHRSLRAVLDTAMGQGDDHVGPCGTDHGNPCARRFEHVARLQTA
nr:hypothetical protein [Roseovarius tolerans]